MTTRKRIGQLLLETGALDSFQLESALAHQRRWGGRIGRAIVYLGFLREEELLSVVGNQLGYPYMPIWDKVIPRDVLSLVPEKVIRARKVLPIARLRENRRGPLVVACADPTDLVVLDELAFATGLEIRPVLASEEELEQAIEAHLSRRAREGNPRAIELPEDTSPLRGVRTSSMAARTGGPLTRSMLH